MVRRGKVVQDLCAYRDEVRRKLRKRYKYIYDAAGTKIGEEYNNAMKEIASSIKAGERKLLEKVQAEYDATAPLDDVRRQLNGVDVEDDTKVMSGSLPQHSFVERTRIADGFLRHPSSFIGDEVCMQLINDMMSLCTLRERCKPRMKHIDAPVLDEAVVLSTPDHVDKEVQGQRLYPLICDPFQCLFCLGDGSMVYKEIVHHHCSKFSLRRHMDRWHLKFFASEDQIPCPHPACQGTVLENIQLLQNHAALKHRIEF